MMQLGVNPQIKLSVVKSSVIFLRVCNGIIYPTLKKIKIYPALTNQNILFFLSTNILLFQIFAIVMVEFFLFGCLYIF